MPAIYPARIRRINGRLVALAVLARYALMTLMGHERPKHTNIIVSRIELIIQNPFCFLISTHRISQCKKRGNHMKISNINKIKYPLYLT